MTSERSPRPAKLCRRPKLSCVKRRRDSDDPHLKRDVEQLRGELDADSTGLVAGHHERADLVGVSDEVKRVEGVVDQVQAELADGERARAEQTIATSLHQSIRAAERAENRRGGRAAPGRRIRRAARATTGARFGVAARLRRGGRVVHAPGRPFRGALSSSRRTRRAKGSSRGGQVSRGSLRTLRTRSSRSTKGAGLSFSTKARSESSAGRGARSWAGPSTCSRGSGCVMPTEVGWTS